MRHIRDTRQSATRTPAVTEAAPAALAPAARVAFGSQAPDPETIPPQDVAEFIAEMISDLRLLADKSGLDTLGRFLEVAEREAKWSSGTRAE